MPFRPSGPIDVTPTSMADMARPRSETRIAPADAALQSRDASTTGGLNQSPSSSVASPRAMPARMARTTWWRDAVRSTARWAPTAALGPEKEAMIPSPVCLTTVPPARVTAPTTAWS